MLQIVLNMQIVPNFLSGLTACIEFAEQANTNFPLRRLIFVCPLNYNPMTQLNMMLCVHQKLLILFKILDDYKIYGT
jgi:hypothetical protein